MNEYFALLIPVIASIILIIMWPKHVVWWEMCLPVIVGLVIIFTMKSCEEHYNISDTEYLSNHVVKACYEEPWDEYIHKTCSYTTCTGSGNTQSCTTHYYDCSYVKNHQAEYYLIDDAGNRYNITNQKFQHLLNVWKNSTFVDMDRNYHSYDGDMYETYWQGDKNNLISTHRTHSYINRVQASSSIYNFKELKEKEIKQYQLYEYPKIDKYSMNSILSKDYKITKAQQNHFNVINGLLGKKKQVQTFLCIWKNKSIESAIKQKQYWKGGNKNELIVCIGLDKNEKIEWAYIFSWTEHNIIHIKLRDYIMSQKGKKLDTWKLRNYTYNAIDKDWKRTSFKKFEFLRIELSNTQILWIYIIVFIFTIGLCIFAVYNDIDPIYNTKQNNKLSIKDIYNNVVKWIKNKCYW